MKRFSVLGLTVTLIFLTLALLMGYSMSASQGAHPAIAAAKLPKVDHARQFTASNNWLVEVVDAEEGTGADNSLALDKANRPHIAYSDPGPGDLKYAWFNGTVWQTETVDAQGFVGRSASLSLDEFDRPHISYIDSTNANLKYASYIGSSWQIETVDSTGSYYTALVLDKSNRPHISYYASMSPTVKYAWYNGVTWEKEAITITTPAFDPRNIALKLDSLDRPHIIYHLCYNSSCEIKHTWHDGSQWQIESASYGQFFSLALDTSGQPRLSDAQYSDWPPGLITTQLSYRWRDDVEWHTETLANSAGQVSLALDALDHPHIVNHDWMYIRGSNFLQYRWYDGLAWHSEDVSNVGYWNQYDRNVSLTLDTSGRPHVSYFDALTRQLKYAQRWPMALSKEAEPQTGLHQGDTLNYTLTLDAPGLHVSLWDPLLPGISYVSDSISSTLLPVAVYSPSINAVIWEGTLPNSNTQTIHFQVIANGLDTGSLSLPIANTAWLTDTDNFRSLSAIVIVNGAKSYLPIISKN